MNTKKNACVTPEVALPADANRQAQGGLIVPNVKRRWKSWPRWVDGDSLDLQGRIGSESEIGSNVVECLDDGKLDLVESLLKIIFDG